MSDDRDMPKAVLTEENRSTFAYAKYLEAKNATRASLARKALLKKRFVFGSCLLMAVGVYGFTITRMKQETFLDDFEEPARVEV